MLAAVIVMDCSVAALTVKPSALDVIPLCAAVILMDPMATPVARPLALILAVAGLEETQVAELVRFCVLPSLKVPVAVN